MKSIFKHLLMTASCHGFICARRVQWIFNVLGLRSA